MNNPPITILLIEDNPGDARLLGELLREAGGSQLELAHADRLSIELGCLHSGGIDAILLNLSLPHSKGLETFRGMQAQMPGVPIVVLTGLADEALAIQAMQAGAQDYLVEGQVDGYAIVRALRYAIERQRVRAQLEETMQALRDGLARLAGAIGSAMDAIISIDAEQRITLFNAAAERMFQCSAAEVLGSPLDRFISSQQREAHRVHVRNFAETGLGNCAMASLDAFNGLRANGEEFPIEATISQIETAGEKVCTIFLRDITERRRAEQALMEERALLARRIEERTAELGAANAELARAARLKDDFLASMSHELRTPLNSILGLSEVLQEGIYGSLTQEQLQRVAIIEQSGRYLLTLINDILDLAKIGAGKMELDCQSLEIGEVCYASTQFIKQLAFAKHIHVSMNIDPAVGMVWADARRLKQILVNLLSNAVKFTHQVGALVQAFYASGCPTRTQV
jgi:PAS domain S-box-containing protein